MVLSDRDIIQRIERGRLVVEPFEEENVEPSSVDLRIGGQFLIVEKSEAADVVDIRESDDGLEYTETLQYVTIEPGDFVLASTIEHVHLPHDLSAEVLGRSSLGRLGLSVHQTAGYIDPGFAGQITLELSNHGPAPVRIHEGQRICQIVFSELSSPADEPYGHEGSQYQSQSGATPSGMNFE